MYSLFSDVALLCCPLWEVTDDQLALPCPCFCLFMLQVFGVFPQNNLFPYLCLSVGVWVSSPAHGEILKAEFSSAQGWVRNLCGGWDERGHYLHPQGDNFPNATSWQVGIAAGCASCADRELGMSSSWLRAGLCSLPCGAARSLSLCAGHSFSRLTCANTEQ